MSDSPEIFTTSLPAQSKRIMSSSELSSTWIFVSPSTSCNKTAWVPSLQVGAFVSGMQVIALVPVTMVNVAAPPSEGNFIVPSIVKRGPLTLAISTEGSSPAVSKAVRKEVEMHYGKEFARYLRFVEKVRKQAIQQIKDKGKREKFLNSLASEESFYILRTEGYDAISQKVLSALK